MLRFGLFELDPARRRLMRAGEELHLTPKAFALLTLLIDAAPRVVPKSEIHRCLWPNGVVSDATLAGLVSALRRVLADHQPPFIRAVHRVGYAFDAPLVEDERAWSTVVRWLALKDRILALAEGENLVGRDPQAQVRLDH